MSRRARAIAFGCAAVVCAGLAAAVTGGYRTDLEHELGPMRSVLVARARIPEGKALRPAEVGRLLEVRRVPARFAPTGALSSPEQTIGRAPAAAIPAGAYLLAAQLRTPGRHRREPRSQLAGGRRPVPISVVGTQALAASDRNPVGVRVDVIVTTESNSGGGGGRTYVAAEGVELVALTPRGDDTTGLPGAGAGSATATLALTRSEALRLIQAENFARQVRLIPR